MMNSNHSSTHEVAQIESQTIKGKPRENTTQQSIAKRWSTKIKNGVLTSEKDPRSYSNMKRYVIIFIVALCSMTGTLNSFIYMPGVIQIISDLNTNTTGINGSIAVYIVFLGIAPLFWASMSEVYGRRPMYIISISISVLGSILCAMSRNITMFIIFRLLQACGTSAGQTLGAGTIADMVGKSKRGGIYGMFYVGSLLGPAVGPALGGILCYYFGWRSTFYFSTALCTVLLVLNICFVPETFRKRYVDTENPHKITIQQAETPNNTYQQNPTKKGQNIFTSLIAMLTDPTVLLITLYNSVIFGSLYFLNPTLSVLFQSLYKFNSWQIGLCYFVFGIGLMIGSIISGFYTNYIFRKTTRDGEKPIPELRLKAAFPAFLLIPGGFVIYGWTSEKEVSVYAPLFGLFNYALGQMFAFNPTSVYLFDSKPGKSASALAINNCARFVVAAITTLFSSCSLDLLGPGILFSILAAINFFNIFAVILVLIYGARWRVNVEHVSLT